VAHAQPGYRFDARLWVYQGKAAWHFVTLPLDVSDEIEELTAPTRRGFGSVRVEVTIGTTTWQTSIFPDTKAESYVLPIKKPVRATEQLAVDDLVDITLRLVE
jgi:hypothetical protein